MILQLFEGRMFFIYKDKMIFLSERHKNQAFCIILEESYNLFTHKRFGRMTGNWVTNWQPYLFLRFAVSCLT